MFANLSSGTALQQDSVIRKVGRKHFMMNILAAVHFAYIFSFAVIMSEINQYIFSFAVIMSEINRRAGWGLAGWGRAGRGPALVWGGRSC